MNTTSNTEKNNANALEVPNGLREYRGSYCPLSTAIGCTAHTLN